ncbi:hypothetical protein TL16_g09678 [Triparma laevis f. inornata]|uniref:ATP-dependent DNA helicase n=1 Tax=Triparma laevis f. inornata TaxID=1714386 RepID=A0A9W7EMY1_9STRA|nr:hypothetical protein TL16_g09678 [Triparma laevis f. inornata]
MSSPHFRSPKKSHNPYAPSPQHPPQSAPGTISSMSSFTSNSTRAPPQQRAQSSPVVRPYPRSSPNQNIQNADNWGKNVSKRISNNNDDNWGKPAINSGTSVGGGWGAYENRFDGWRPTFANDNSSQVRRDPVERRFKNNNNDNSDSNNNSNNNSNSKKRPWTDKNSVSSKFAGGRNSNFNQRAKPFDPKTFRQSLQHTPLEDSQNYLTQYFKGEDVFTSHPQLSKLNSLQKSILTLALLQKTSVFFTGPAGTGKSLVVKSLIYLNHLMPQPKKIAVTATTGIAACALGGTTINSFFGIGLGDMSAAALLKKVMKNEHVKTRISSTDFLVIDEVSMMEGEMFDKLDEIAKRVRQRPSEPFGGLVLILTGDFYQLPPIKVERGYAFQAECWNDVVGRSVVLEEVYRSGGDPVLVKILDEARVGCLSADSVRRLREHQNNPPRPETPKEVRNLFRGRSAITKRTILTLAHSRLQGVRIENTRLECKNRNVDAGNEMELQKLRGEEQTYYAADDEGGYAPGSANGMLKNMSAPPLLTLKIGAQVMLLKNLDTERGLCNGSRGVVTGFMPFSDARHQGDKEYSLPAGWARNTQVPVVTFAGPEGPDSGNCEEIPIYPATWEVKESDKVIGEFVVVIIVGEWD